MKPFKIDRVTGKKQFLRKCQWKAIHWVLEKITAALFMDMGLGKTVAILSVIKALLHRGELDKPVLVVGPIRVIYGVWWQEAAEWSHTKRLTFSIVHGSAKKRTEALDTKADIYLINPENLTWLLIQLRKFRSKEKWPFSMLVVDESSMFKSVGSKRFRKLRYAVRFFKWRIILTGTPRPNSLMELWPQLYIVDEGARLGATFANFKTRFFAPENVHVDYPTYVPRKGAEAYIHRQIEDVALSMEDKDWLDFPPTVPNYVYVDLPPKARKLYNEFEREMFLKLDRGDVDALTAASVSGKCWQMANGAIYSMDRDTGEKIWEQTHEEKLDALAEIIEETGSPVLVAYWFKHDLIRLRKRYPKAPTFGNQKDDLMERRWNAGKYPIAFAHYFSAAHGMNLQFGGHTIALFSMTWSYERYDQLIKRIGGARAQQRVTVHHILARDTTDEAQRMKVEGKQAGNRATLSALNRYRKQRAITDRRSA